MTQTLRIKASRTLDNVECYLSRVTKLSLTYYVLAAPSPLNTPQGHTLTLHYNQSLHANKP